MCKCAEVLSVDIALRNSAGAPKGEHLRERVATRDAGLALGVANVILAAVLKHLGVARRAPPGVLKAANKFGIRTIGHPGIRA